MSKRKRFTNRWFLEMVSIASVCVACTWAIFDKIVKEPMQLQIDIKQGQIDLQKSLSDITKSKYKNDLRERDNKIVELKAKIEVSGKNPNNFSKRVPSKGSYPGNTAEAITKPLPNDKPKPQTGELDITSIYYQPPGSDVTKIEDGSEVQGGGRIWFEIRMPEKTGYFLAYSEDSSGKKYNLFPGTFNAYMNGDYLLPHNLKYPKTEIQKYAGTYEKEWQLLNEGKVMIGAYILDESVGKESFHFFYLRETEAAYKEIFENAIDTGAAFHPKGIKDIEMTIPQNIVFQKPDYRAKIVLLKKKENLSKE